MPVALKSVRLPQRGRLPHRPRSLLACGETMPARAPECFQREGTSLEIECWKVLCGERPDAELGGGVRWGIYF